MRLAVEPSSPPKPNAACLVAAAAHRTGPSVPAPTWLRVGKTGDKKIARAWAQRARITSARLWAELVRHRWPGRGSPGQRPSLKCTPARNRAANLVSPATVSGTRRVRQARATARANTARSAMPSSRNTTPHSPAGSCMMTLHGSGMRAASVKNHNTGTSEKPLRDCRALTMRAHATSL